MSALSVTSVAGFQQTFSSRVRSAVETYNQTSPTKAISPASITTIENAFRSAFSQAVPNGTEELSSPMLANINHLFTQQLTTLTANYAQARNANSRIPYLRQVAADLGSRVFATLSTETDQKIQQAQQRVLAPAPSASRAISQPASGPRLVPPSKGHPFELVLPEPQLDSTQLIKILNETIGISRAGSYQAGPETIDFQFSPGTHSCTHTPQSEIRPRYATTELAAIAQDTLSSAHQLHCLGAKSIGVLNLANDTDPGGKPGALTQEENLMRRTNAQIYLTHAKAQSLYPISIATKNGALSTPGITVLRNSHYQLLTKPFRIHLIHTAAHSFKHNGGNPNDRNYYATTLRNRIASALYAAYLNSDDTLVLGALGCGAYENNPKAVSLVFIDLLKKEFKGCFAKVYFAITPGANFDIFAETIMKNGGGAFLASPPAVSSDAVELNTITALPKRVETSAMGFIRDNPTEPRINLKNFRAQLEAASLPADQIMAIFEACIK